MSILTELKSLTFQSVNQIAEKITSVYDLRLASIENYALTQEQELAIERYTKLQYLELSKISDDSEYAEAYKLFQVIAKNRPFSDMLDEKFDYLDHTSL